MKCRQKIISPPSASLCENVKIKVKVLQQRTSSFPKKASEMFDCLRHPSMETPASSGWTLFKKFCFYFVKNRLRFLYKISEYESNLSKCRQ